MYRQRVVTTNDPDLDWLLTVAPSLMGASSTHGGIVAVLEGGGSGAFDSSALRPSLNEPAPTSPGSVASEPSGGCSTFPPGGCS